jgi:hypothetical protein
MIRVPGSMMQQPIKMQVIGRKQAVKYPII